MSQNLLYLIFGAIIGAIGGVSAAAGAIQSQCLDAGEFRTSAYVFSCKPGGQ